MTARALLLASATAALPACGSRASAPETGAPSIEPKRAARAGGLVVIAPHPDDEALIAAGLIRSAVERGDPVRVVVLTDGEFECRTTTSTRRAESLAGLRVLGLGPEHVAFLDFPDGSLAHLGKRPLPPPLAAPTCDGRARPHELTRTALVEAIRGVVAVERPARVVVTHPEDTHPDHAAAYSLVRAAIEGNSSAPELWRALVHNEDCWPTGPLAAGGCQPGAFDPLAPMPELTGSLLGYRATDRVEVPVSSRDPDRTKNEKVNAIGAHRSQTLGDERSYLFSFARRDEMFFVERTPRRVRVPIAAGEPRSFEFERDPSAGGSPGGRRIRYRVTRSDGDPGLELTRRTERDGGAELVRTLGSWLVPHDFPQDPRFEVSVTRVQLDPAVFEIELAVPGRFLGVAVDPDLDE